MSSPASRHHTRVGFNPNARPSVYRWYCRCGARGRAIYTEGLDALKAGQRHAARYRKEASNG